MGSSHPEAPRTAGRRFAESLRQRSDAALVALLRARGDLVVPSPATLRSLAARAAGHASLERALAHRSALELQVVEAVAARPGVPRGSIPTLLGAAAGDGTGVGGTGVDSAGVDDVGAIDEAVGSVLVVALVWEDDGVLWPSPGLDEVLGPHVAGLGPARIDRARTGAGPDTVVDGDPDVAARVRAAGTEQRAVLDALAWGPPVGRIPPGGTRQRAAVDGLLTASLLTRADAQHVIMPRDVALELRDGRTHRAPALRPRPEGRQVAAATVAAESAAAALELVRRVTVLRAAWTDEPPRVLRSGGLGVRDLRRLAAALEWDEAGAAFVAEIAAAAGLVSDDGEPDPTFVTLDAMWTELEDADRWAALARAWLSSRRTPWLVGTRDDGGALRSALSGDLERGWVPRLRGTILGVLGATEQALTADAVLDVLTWESPRNSPPRSAVEGLLAEAAHLGVTGAGALSGPGRSLVATPGSAAGSGEEAATALRGILPGTVDEILLQGDLTGVVPGRASRELALLVELTADTESRGAATTVRFSPASVTRALDRGRTADDLLADLARHSPVPVPQPLEYLIRDTARRHGAVRVGVASSYLRAADEVTLAGLERDPALAHLGLVRLAPTVLAASVPPALLHETLRERGVVSALEGPDGRVLDVRRTRPSGVVGRRLPERSARSVSLAARSRADTAAPGAPARTRSDPVTVVAGLRAAEEQARRAQESPDTPGTAAVGTAVSGTTAPGTAASARSAGSAGSASAGSVSAGSAAAGPAAGDTGARSAPAAGGDGRQARASSSARGVPAGGTTPSATGDVPDPGTQPLADGLALLHEAVREGSLVRVDVVGGAGKLERRTLRPMRLDGGRLRAVDPSRDAEITVAVHRIARVSPHTPTP